MGSNELMDLKTLRKKTSVVVANRLGESKFGSGTVVSSGNTVESRLIFSVVFFVLRSGDRRVNNLNANGHGGSQCIGTYRIL